jgi:putative aminopeptidase FrvX
MMTPCSRGLAIAALSLFALANAFAQKASGNLRDDIRDLVETPAVSGYEQELAASITARVKAVVPQATIKTDAMANLTVTMGTGSPHQLLVAPMDEPGFVVSGFNPEGYLRVQRLPQAGSLPLFNELYSAQPVKVRAGDKWIEGAVAGLSIHLQPQVQHPLSLADLDNIYVDVGATTAPQAHTSGVDFLSPMAIDRTFFAMGFGKWTAPAIGDRFGTAALIELLRQVDPAKLKGTFTVAFVAQQWLGARGLQRVLYQNKPDEVIYIGRLIRPAPPAPGAAAGQGARETPGFKQTPGSGVLIASDKPEADLSGFGAELQKLGRQNEIAVKTDFSAAYLPRGGYLPQPLLPNRSVHLAVATAWPSTPSEVIDGNDVAQLVALLEDYLQGAARKIELAEAKPLPEPVTPARPSVAPTPESILKQLIETYGVSGGHEENVRKTVAQLLPSWAKAEVDDAGNVVLHWQAAPGNKSPSVAVVAHMDEIGYEVRAVLPDGRLELQSRGGGVLAYFLGHAALVHSANGMHPGVLQLPEGWDKPDFQWPRGPRMMTHMDVGAHNPEQVAQLGINPGDFVTIPKRYHKLLGRRAAARAFDDRIGCAALVSATWALGPNLNGRDVTFIWSTSEELGLEGAAAAARRMAAQGKSPDYVFAVDTFVSADSPLESKRFADAILGQGFVVRAVDNSNIVPRNLVEKVVQLSRAGGIAVQYGVTGGGNDGAAFTPFGSTDVALGWPLRYSHSPGEVVDVRDLEALAKIIAAAARSW